MTGMQIINNLEDAIDRACAEIDRLRAALTQERERNERLREALEPFHQVASTWSVGVAEGEPAPRLIQFSMSWENAKRVYEAFEGRRARKVMEEGDGKGS